MPGNIPTSYTRLISSLGDSIKQIAKRSDSFSTGLKNPEMKDDIAGALLAQSLKTNKDFIGAATSNANNLDAMLRTHQQLIDTYLDTVSQMSVIALSMKSPQSDTVRAAAEITFNELKSTATDIAENAGFAGISLMNGKFNSANQFQASNDVYNAKPVASAALTTITNNVTNRTGTLTVAAQPTQGDTITFGTGGNTVTFTFVDANPDASQNQIAKGADLAGTALKMLKAFQASEADEMKKYSFSVNTATALMTITQNAGSRDALTASNFASSSTGARITQAFAAGAGTAFDLSAYTGQELLGQVGDFTLISSTTGVGNVATITPYVNASGLTTLPTIPAAHAADVLAKFTFTIGAESYNGYLMDQNAGNTADVENRIYCLKSSDDVSGNNLTGKVFSIGLQASADISDAANTSTLMAALNVDAALTSFQQTRAMTVNTSSLENEYQGMSAVYTGTSFTGLSVDNVTCTSTTLTVNLLDATSASEAYTYAIPANPTIAAGTKVTLTGTSGATIDLTLPSVLDFTTDESRGLIASSLASALGASGNSTFTIGTSSNQKLTVDFVDLRFSVLTGNVDLKIDNQANADTASQEIENVINAINTAKAKSASSSVRLDVVRAVMQTTVFNLSAAIEALTSVEVVENYTKQSLEVARVNSQIAALRSAQSADASVNSVLNG